VKALRNNLRAVRRLPAEGPKIRNRRAECRHLPDAQSAYRRVYPLLRLRGGRSMRAHYLAWSAGCHHRSCLCSWRSMERLRAVATGLLLHYCRRAWQANRRDDSPTPVPAILRRSDPDDRRELTCAIGGERHDMPVNGWMRAISPAMPGPTKCRGGCVSLARRFGYSPMQFVG